MSRFELLVGSKSFWERLRQDIGLASKRALIQAMTFEGDAAGKPVAAAMRDSPASDRRLLVDHFTNYFISDRFTCGPARLDPAFRRELNDTRTMFKRLVDDGVKVRNTNPVGILFSHFPNRNHKKLMVMDDVAYVGGINFSDHNYEWHDLMVRIDDAAVADELTRDFDATWNGDPQNNITAMSGVTFYFFGGRDNAPVFEKLLRKIRRAERSIKIISPYLTFPFCGELREKANSGVSVTLFTPDANNKKTVQNYLLWEAARSNFDVRLYHRMSHLKAIMIDEHTVIVGSSNFDFVSYNSQEELVAVIDDPALVRAFTQQVLEHDLAATRAMDLSDVSNLRGQTSHAILKLVAALCKINRAAPRHATSIEV